MVLCTYHKALVYSFFSLFLAVFPSHCNFNFRWEATIFCPVGHFFPRAWRRAGSSLSTDIRTNLQGWFSKIGYSMWVKFIKQKLYTNVKHGCYHNWNRHKGTWEHTCHLSSPRKWTRSLTTNNDSFSKCGLAQQEKVPPDQGQIFFS